MEKTNRLFCLGTTSFIFPDHILPNVQKIGPFFDEIELLVFESLPETVLPTPEQIQALVRLSHTLDLTYNVHLPVDISLTHPDARHQKRAALSLSALMARLAPLKATTHTLHLAMEKTVTSGPTLLTWQRHAAKGLDTFLQTLSNPRSISIETLWYPPAWLQDLIYEFDTSLCLDAGHLFTHGHDLSSTYDLFQDRLPLIHLHGVAFAPDTITDHTALDRLPAPLFEQVIQILKRYKGTVSLEVFNRKHLNRSLSSLSQAFHQIPVLPF